MNHTVRDASVNSAQVKPVMRGWLHLVGAVVLLACSPILLVRARTWPQVAWVLCYVVGVGSMMITSALFHRVNWSPSKRRAWKRADHSTIFLAITGSYLAISGLTMHGTIRDVLIIVISVMSGFDAQLKEKILGFNTHIKILPRY